tara:strand:- start:850 stop:1308 length:459 start_codon:yes stop_codon:yes gene_type:complete
MTTSELREKIRILIPQIYKSKQKADEAAIEYDELTKFPELKAILVDLLTSDFDAFLASIDWVAPRPTTFRINLKNDQNFYLIYNKRSWIAQVEGKKYYLLNLPEEQHAAEAISRILRYGTPPTKEDEGGDDDLGGDIEDIGGSEEIETETEA